MKKTKALVEFSVIIVLLFFFLSSVSAVNIGEGTIFKITGSNCSYYTANDFTFTNITVYSTSLNINGGNITTYPSSDWVNMSIEILSDEYFYFSNNITAKNITIENNFANFPIVNNLNYILHFQSNSTRYQTVLSASNSITFTDILPNSWYVRFEEKETVYEEISFEIAETNIKMMIMGLTLIPIITILGILIAAIYRHEETDWRIVLTLFAAIGIASVLLLVFFVIVVIIQTA